MTWNRRWCCNTGRASIFAPPGTAWIPDSPPLAREIAAKGQRVATVLVYLNDDYQDGETDFPELNWRFKGRKGDALWFWNVDAQGRPAAGALHAGIAPGNGEKWLLSQWIRQESAQRLNRMSAGFPPPN